MVRRIMKENYDVTEYIRFGVLNDDVTIYNGYYPDSKYKHIRLPKNAAFGNISMLVETLRDYTDIDIPNIVEDFDDVDFNKITSTLELGWMGTDNVYHTISFQIYNYPTMATEKDLRKYGIELK